MTPFVPLTTRQGLSAAELGQAIGRRSVVVWGSGFLGRVLRRSLQRGGLPVAAYCDQDPRLQAGPLDGLPVLSPERALADAGEGRAFLVLASPRFRLDMEVRCQNAGLDRGIAWISYLKLARPQAVIEVSGLCGLRCPSCPQGRMPGSVPRVLMPASTYARVLGKLLAELPGLSCVELAAWGEPTENPELSDIIRLTEAEVPCSFSTHLQGNLDLESLVLARPSQWLVSASGQGETYERHHLGANWERLVANLHTLGRLCRDQHARSAVTVLYHLYRDTQDAASQAPLRALCAEYGFRFTPTWAYLNPYDELLSLRQGWRPDERARGVLSDLAWRLDAAAAAAALDVARPCLCQRVFPVINADCSVSLCHLYTAPRVAADFLETSMGELLTLREAHGFCCECQRHALHRLDIEHLVGRHGGAGLLIPGDEGDQTC